MRMIRCFIMVVPFRRSIQGALSLTALLALATGCDSPGFTRKANAPTAPTSADVGEATTTGAALPDKDGEPTVDTVGLSISGEIAKACGISARGDGKAASPSFDFDSAALA